MAAAPQSGTSTAAPRGRDRAAEFADALAAAEHEVTKRLAAILREHRCSVEMWRTLRLLSDGRRHTMAQLAEAALLPGPSLTRLVDRLVADNLVYRLVDEHDRRRVLVYPTERGRALHARAVALVDAESAAILGGLSAQEADRLIALLGRVRRVPARP